MQANEKRDGQRHQAKMRALQLTTSRWDKAGQGCSQTSLAASPSVGPVYTSKTGAKQLLSRDSKASSWKVHGILTMKHPPRCEGVHDAEPLSKFCTATDDGNQSQGSTCTAKRILGPDIHTTGESKMHQVINLLKLHLHHLYKRNHSRSA